MREKMQNNGMGLFGSLKGLASSLVAIAHTRLDLLSTDLEEERERLVSWLAVMLTAFFCLAVGVVLLVILCVVAFWESDRLLVLGVLTGVFLVGGVGAWIYGVHKMKTKPRMFASSLAEFSRDRQELTVRS